MATRPIDRAEAALASVNRENGTAFALAGTLAGGFQGGAWQIVGPDGDSAVLKWSEARGEWAQIVRAARAKVAEARLRGYPTPAWLAAGVTADGFVYQIQEFASGSAATRLTEPLARQLVDVLERCEAGQRPAPSGDPRPD